MVKLVYDTKMKNPKGPYVIVIHANWCGFCKTLMPKFENEVVTHSNFSSELGGLLTLGSIEEAEYDDDVTKKIFGNVDGYPTIRYIYFYQDGTPSNSFDLPGTTPREPKNIIDWINGAVKNDVLVHKNKTKSKFKKSMSGGKKTRKIKTRRKNKKINKK